MVKNQKMSNTETDILDQFSSAKVNFPKVTYYGIALIGFFILIRVVIPGFYPSSSVRFLSLAIYGVASFGLMIYGQNIIKKLNRDYTIWAIFLFFFTGLALIIIGQLNKKDIDTIVVEMKPKEKGSNLNNLPEITFGTSSELLMNALQNTSFTLKHMIKNFKDYTKENTLLFPIMAVYELNDRDEHLTPEVLKALDDFAEMQEYSDFQELLKDLQKLTPEQIRTRFE
jgi:hypothetical protein